ncbi:MAG TPA: PRC-barrel domain-containing protein [Candidatus Thermoplasmatota archaeon]|nr:PRC-barrel domain-containing protein [Candidatus Thermoplasmatota archaeon]
MKLLASDIKGKTVMSDEGMMLGRLRNIVLEEKSGELTQVLIEPAEDIDPRLYRRDQRGFLVFPFENIRAVRDVIVVSTVNAGA